MCVGVGVCVGVCTGWAVLASGDDIASTTTCLPAKEDFDRRERERERAFVNCTNPKPCRTLPISTDLTSQPCWWKKSPNWLSVVLTGRPDTTTVSCCCCCCALGGGGGGGAFGLLAGAAVAKDTFFSLPEYPGCEIILTGFAFTPLSRFLSADAAVDAIANAAATAAAADAVDTLASFFPRIC